MLLRIHHVAGLERHGSPHALGDKNGGIAGLHFANSPVSIERYIRKQGPNLDHVNERRNPYRIKTVFGQ